MRTIRNTLLAIASLLLITPLAAAPLESQTEQLVTRLSQNYAKSRDILIRRNTVIAGFSGTGRTVTAENLPEAFRAITRSMFSQTTIFTVVDRDNLSTILREQELQSTGLTDPAAAKRTGALLNADVIITGEVIESGQNVSLNLTLIDVETGKSFSETLSAPLDELVTLREDQLNRAYVRKSGIGITVNFLGQTSAGNNSTMNPFPAFEETGLYRRFGFEVRYRVSEWFMVGSGFDHLWGQLYHIPDQEWSFAGSGIFGNATGRGPFTIDAKGYGIPLIGYFCYSPHRRLSLLAGAGIEYMNITLLGYYEGDSASPGSGGKGFGVNQFGPELQEEAIVYLFRAGFEFFITPRLAFSVLAGYDYGTLPADFGNQWHLPGLREEIGDELDLSGFFIRPSFSMYF